MVIFFFASAAASSAYLTVSEIFPLEMRARTLPLAEQKPVRDHITAYNALLLAADVAS